MFTCVCARRIHELKLNLSSGFGSGPSCLLTLGLVTMRRSASAFFGCNVSTSQLEKSSIQPNSLAPVSLEIKPQILPCGAAGAVATLVKLGLVEAIRLFLHSGAESADCTSRKCRGASKTAQHAHTWEPVLDPEAHCPMQSECVPAYSSYLSAPCSWTLLSRPSKSMYVHQPLQTGAKQTYQALLL